MPLPRRAAQTTALMVRRPSRSASCPSTSRKPEASASRRSKRTHHGVERVSIRCLSDDCLCKLDVEVANGFEYAANLLSVVQSRFVLRTGDTFAQVAPVVTDDQQVTVRRHAVAGIADDGCVLVWPEVQIADQD